MKRRASFLAFVAAALLSASAFAREVLVREPRTLRRWLAGDSPIPMVVVQWIKGAAS